MNSIATGITKEDKKLFITFTAGLSFYFYQKKKMKQFARHIVCLLFVALFGCNNPVDRDMEIEIEIPDPLQPGEVRIKACPDEDNKLSFIMVAKKILIDWGDDTTEEFTPNGVPEGLVHEYIDQNPKHITVHTEEMIDFGACSMINIYGITMQTFGRLQEIYFGKCAHLEEVILRGNDLMHLEIEEANSLTLFDCSFNNLSASALNSLFGSLPFSDEGIIIFRENTGSETCDSSIVLSKGWTVQSLLPDEDWELVPQLLPDEMIKIFTIKYFSDFGNFLKPFFLFDALYTQTVNMENFFGYGLDIALIYNHQINSSNYFVSEMWDKSYNSIYRLNSSINLMLKSTGNTNFSNYIHSAKVLRSYIYFILINCWGDVLYIDETMLENMQNLSLIYRMNKEQLLNLMIEQLLEAEAALPETESDYCLSKSYAQLILSKIYTFQGNYAKALSYITKIMDSGKYVLSADYPDIFESNENKEQLTQYQVIYNNPVFSWEELIKKGEHTPYSRYTEVLLLGSENYLKSGNMQAAVDCLNQVRDRNSRTPATTDLSLSTIEDMILEEYMQDTGKEGLYFFALKRIAKAEKVLGLESFRLLLPIPSQEIFLYPNIDQNPGYIY